MRSLRSAVIATVVAVILAVMATFSPAARADDWFARDKALHFGASAGLALGGYGATALFTEEERPRLVVGGSFALAVGIGKEIADRYTGGDPSWKDLSWDVLGTATGLLTGWLIHRLWHRLGE
jgi:putative lipoprotein